jgi:hypothetical protein
MTLEEGKKMFQRERGGILYSKHYFTPANESRRINGSNVYLWWVRG